MLLVMMQSYWIRFCFKYRGWYLEKNRRGHMGSTGYCLLELEVSVVWWPAMEHKDYEGEAKQHLPIDLGRGNEAVVCLSFETSILQNCE